MNVGQFSWLTSIRQRIWKAYNPRQKVRLKMAHHFRYRITAKYSNTQTFRHFLKNVKHTNDVVFNTCLSWKIDYKNVIFWPFLVTNLGQRPIQAIIFLCLNVYLFYGRTVLQDPYWFNKSFKNDCVVESVDVKRSKLLSTNTIFVCVFGSGIRKSIPKSVAHSAVLSACLKLGGSGCVLAMLYVLSFVTSDCMADRRVSLIVSRWIRGNLWHT